MEYRGKAHVDRLRLELERLRTQVEANTREIEELQARGPEVLDLDGCAELLRLSPRTIEQRVQERRIPFVKLAGHKETRFIKADILSWLRRGAPSSGTSRLHSSRGKPVKTKPRPRSQTGARTEHPRFSEGTP